MDDQNNGCITTIAVVVAILVVCMNCCDFDSEDDYRERGIEKLSNGQADEVTDTEKRAIENYINNR